MVNGMAGAPLLTLDRTIGTGPHFYNRHRGRWSHEGLRKGPRGTFIELEPQLRDRLIFNSYAPGKRQGRHRGACIRRRLP